MTIKRLLGNKHLRQIQLQNRTLYWAVDAVGILTGEENPGAAWEAIKRAHPSLRLRTIAAELAGEALELLTLSGVMRLIQLVEAPTAQRLRGWIADAAARHMAEEADPGLAVRRMRRAYRAKGHSRSWIDQRMHCVSARHDIVHEWHRRGVRESEQFRELTNKLIEGVFGMDAASLLNSKGASRNLRDHLNDLELSLLGLAESVAASLHRQHRSVGMEQLLRDVEDAGRIIGQTGHAIGEAMLCGHGAQSRAA